METSAIDLINFNVVQNDVFTDLFSYYECTQTDPPLNSRVMGSLSGLLNIQEGDIIFFALDSQNGQFDVNIQPGYDFPNIQPINSSIYKVSKN